jgi:hypothetical protein
MMPTQAGGSARCHRIETARSRTENRSLFRIREVANVKDKNSVEQLSYVKNWRTRMLNCIRIAVAIFGVGFTTSMLGATQTTLPHREGPRPQTTNSVPHVQIGVSSNSGIDEALLLEVSKLPGVEIRPTVVSLPGAKCPIQN